MIRNRLIICFALSIVLAVIANAQVTNKDVDLNKNTYSSNGMIDVYVTKANELLLDYSDDRNKMGWVLSGAEDLGEIVEISGDSVALSFDGRSVFIQSDRGLYLVTINQSVKKTIKVTVPTDSMVNTDEIVRQEIGSVVTSDRLSSSPFIIYGISLHTLKNGLNLPEDFFEKYDSIDDLLYPQSRKKNE